MLLNLEDVMIHFDEPRQATPGVWQSDGKGQSKNLLESGARPMDVQTPDKVPVVEDCIWHVSPPPAPFPRVLPGL
jgi:hypothetical protein